MILKVENLTKKYGNFLALDKVSFQINQGDIFGFLGPNGSGKTTTIRILATISRADSGTVILDGHNLFTNPNYVRSIINYMPESFGLYGWMSAEEYLKMFSNVYKVKYQDDLLKSVGLGENRKQNISTFSRGMKQRLGFARSLINSPKLLLLDEPTSGLDPLGRIEIQDLLKQINKTKGITILLSTHLLDDVDRLCNRIAIINKGKIVEEGKLEELEEFGAQRLLVRTSKKPNKILKIPDVDLSILDEGYLIELHRKATINETLEILIENKIDIQEVVAQKRKIEDLFIENIKTQNNEKRLH